MTKLVRYNPNQGIFSPFKRVLGGDWLNDWMDNEVVDVFHSLYDDMKNLVTPDQQIVYRETDKEYILKVELPGFDKEQISVELSDFVLEIRADDEERHVHKHMHLIDRIDPKKVKAELKNGLLTVTIEKEREKKSQVNIIEVK